VRHVLVGVPAQRPHGKYVPVRGVRNSARAVEDPRNAFLRPVAVGTLPRAQVGHAPAHGGHVRSVGGHEGEQGPRGAHDPTALVVAKELHALAGVLLVEAAGEVFAPPPVGVLVLEEEGARLVQRGAVQRFPRLEEAFHSKPRRVGEAAAPAPVPRPVGPLNVEQELPGPRHRAHHLFWAVVREVLVEQSQRPDGRVGALHVRVVDHDVAKDLRRVQPLEPRVAPVVFVGGKASVGVLQGEQHVGGVEVTLVRHVRPLGPLSRRHRHQVLHREHGFEAFSRAIGNGPTCDLKNRKEKNTKEVSSNACGRDQMGNIQDEEERYLERTNTESM